MKTSNKLPVFLLVLSVVCPSVFGEPAGQPTRQPVFEWGKPVTLSNDMDETILSAHAWSIDFFVFKDKSGKEMLHFSHEEKMEIQNGKQRDFGLKMVYFKKYLIVTQYDIKETEDSDYIETGVYKRENNLINVYDMSGKIIFKKINIPYHISDISANGKVFAVVNDNGYGDSGYGEDDYHSPGPEVHANPPKSELVIYSEDGTVVHREKDDPIVNVSISPSGTYLVYSTGNPEYQIKIIDLATGREFPLKRLIGKGQEPSKAHHHRYAGIDDDGNLFGVERSGSSEHDMKKVILHRLNEHEIEPLEKK